MAATAQFIEFDNHEAINIASAGGFSTKLVTNFRVFSRGPAHVAGLIFTTNFWVTTGIATAKFQFFSGNFEVWQAIAVVPGNNVTFEYVIFCDDHRDNQNVKKIFHSNCGNTFQIKATHF